MPIENEEGEGLDDTTSEAPAGGDAPASDAAPAAEWDGGWDSFESQPWAKDIPASAKEHLRSRYDTSKFYRDIVDVDDRTAALTKEMDALRKSLGEETTKYKNEVESWKTKHGEAEGRFRALSAEVEQDRVSRREAELQNKFGDIYATWKDDASDDEKANGPLAMFVTLTDIQKIPDEKAAKMVRAAFDLPTPGAAPAASAQPERPKTRDVTPPDSVTLASRDGLNPSEAIRKPKPMSPEEARREYDRKTEEMEAREDAAR